MQPQAPADHPEATGSVVPMLMPSEAIDRIEAVAKRLGIHPMVALGRAVGEFCVKHEEDAP